MKTTERDRHDWMIIPMILVILVIGFLGVLVAGQWALRFSPRWQLDANMESNLDPNSDFLTGRPNGFIEPVDPSILTQPVWAGFFLTPGASFATKTAFTTTSIASTAAALASPTLPATPTMVLPVTSTSELTAIPTSTSVPLPWVPTPTSRPPHTNPPTSTAVSTPTNTPTATQTPTPTDTPPPIADLQVTLSDGATHYVPDSTRVYTLIVSNPFGPSGVGGATVMFTLPAQISAASWSCAGAGGAVCTASGNGNINDLVNLPLGSSITYTVNVTIVAGASGDLINTASVSVPAGFTDPTPFNDAWTDTDTLITTVLTPGQMALPHDLPTFNLSPSGSSLTLNTNVAADGDSGVWDLIYYELPAGSGIMMDQVIIEVSDGYNWYTILNWGDNNDDAHTNISISSIGGAEDDNREITSGDLYDTSGVAIDLDDLPIPSVTYSYIRITAPAGDSDNGCDIDAIVILP